MNRRSQCGWMIVLSAITLVAPYIIQGALASAHNPSIFHELFWLVDFGLWAFRAPIEAWVMFYMFSTQPKRKGHATVLTVIEVTLLCLTTLTVGPAMRALGHQQTMAESLAEPWFTAWNLGIAAYASLMMAGAGFAYKFQPVQIVEVVEEEKLLTTEERRRRVYEAVKGGQLNVAALATLWETTRQTIYRDLRWLQEKGYISSNGKGEYAVEKEYEQDAD